MLDRRTTMTTQASPLPTSRSVPDAPDMPPTSKRGRLRALTVLVLAVVAVGCGSTTSSQGQPSPSPDVANSIDEWETFDPDVTESNAAAEVVDPTAPPNNDLCEDCEPDDVGRVPFEPAPEDAPFCETYSIIDAAAEEFPEDPNEALPTYLGWFNELQAVAVPGPADAVQVLIELVEGAISTGIPINFDQLDPRTETALDYLDLYTDEHCFGIDPDASTTVESE